MATEKNGLVSGRVGPLVYYVVNGQQRIRIHNPNVKQTERTKVATLNFSKAAEWSHQFRRAVDDQLPVKYPGSLRNRLNGRIFQSVNSCWNEEMQKFIYLENSFSGMEGFEFDQKNKVSDHLKIMPEMLTEKEGLSVSFAQFSPRRDLIFPPQVLRCVITVAVFIVNPATGQVSTTNERLRMECFNDESLPRVTQMTFPIPKGSLAIATLFVEFFAVSPSDWKSLKDKYFYPGMICKAIYRPSDPKKKSNRSKKSNMQVQTPENRIQPHSAVMTSGTQLSLDFGTDATVDHPT